MLWRHDDVIGGMTHLLSRPLSPSPSRTRNRAHLLSIPPAARSSPDGLRAHAFTHVVGRTIVSIRLSTPASQTTWSLRSFEVIQHATRSFEVRGHFTYHWTLFWTWNNSSRICSPIGTKNFDLVSFKFYSQKTILLKKSLKPTFILMSFHNSDQSEILTAKRFKIFLWFSYLPLVLAQQQILD